MLENDNQKVCVIGLGYIGLPTAITIAQANYKVFGYDIDKTIVTKLQKGVPHVEEPGLIDELNKVIASDRLEIGHCIAPADIFVICVPTPNISGSKDPDLKYVTAAIDSVSSVIEPGNLVLLESTCPPGTTEKMYRQLIEKSAERKERSSSPEEFYFCYCPERILPGNIFRELRTNSRVIGGVTAVSSEKALNFYKDFVETDCFIASSPTTAELCKLAENSFRDVNIAFANELSIIAEQLNVDPFELVSLANMHPRVNILNPGPGVGGHCIAVDPWFIVSAAPGSSRLIETARKINDAKPRFIIDKVEKLAREHPTKPIICFGLTYKPDVDDVRESPGLAIFLDLQATFGDRVYAIDPYLGVGAYDNLNSIQILEAEAADSILVILVNHKQFRNLNPKTKDIVDACGLFSKRIEGME